MELKTLKESTYATLTNDRKQEILKKLIHFPYPSSHQAPFTEIPFGELIIPWGKIANEELKNRAGSTYTLFSPAAHKKMQEALISQLSTASSSSLAAFLHLNRLKKKLQGDTPKERYLYFVEEILCKPEFLLEFFQELPGLTRIITSQILLWIDSMEELLSRLMDDAPDIQTTFSKETDLGIVVDVTHSLSDPHLGNRSVAKLVFENGLQLIYKPKALDLDVSFMQFIDQLNCLGLNPPLKGYQLICREGYGWVEFIEAPTCTTQEEVSRFYERTGMNICLMYLFEATDCHLENLIASGEFPILIDLECLFHPILVKENESARLTSWDRSVFKSGYLPAAANDLLSIETSALFAPEEQISKKEIAKWSEINTDQMQFKLEKSNSQRASHRAKFKNEIVNPVDYLPQILSGFEKAYQLIQTHRLDLANALENLMSHPVRALFRNTYFYFLTLDHLTDPRILHSSTNEEEALNILGEFFLSSNNEHLEPIVTYEKAALKVRDIPLFTSMPLTCDLYHDGELILKNCYKSPIATVVTEKIFNMNRMDLDLQLQFITHAIYAEKANDAPLPREYTPYQSSTLTPVFDSHFILNAAISIGEKILKISLPLSDGRRHWVSIQFSSKTDKYGYFPLSDDFYSGSSGIALFFAGLYQMTSDTKWKDSATSILEQLYEPFEKNKKAAHLSHKKGFMTGLGGIIYAFLKCGILLNDPRWIENAVSLTTSLTSEDIQKDQIYDFIGGNAGLALVLLSLYQTTQDPTVLKKAEECGEALLKSASKQSTGIAWGSPEGYCLTGMSHGAAGIAYALFHLGSVLSREDFTKSAEQALAYEASLFSKTNNNWADLRASTPSFNAFQWCHGSPGIALSRLCILPFSSSLCRQELEIALSSTISHLKGNIDHLCCGNVGRLSILWNASIKLDRPDLKQLVLDQTALLLEKYTQDNHFTLFSSLDKKLDSPSFMQGLSGIGYFLLRVIDEKGCLPDPLIAE